MELPQERLCLQVGRRSHHWSAQAGLKRRSPKATSGAAAANHTDGSDDACCSAVLLLFAFFVGCRSGQSADIAWLWLCPQTPEDMSLPIATLGQAHYGGPHQDLGHSHCGSWLGPHANNWLFSERALRGSNLGARCCSTHPLLKLKLLQPCITPALLQ